MMLKLTRDTRMVGVLAGRNEIDMHSDAPLPGVRVYLPDGTTDHVDPDGFRLYLFWYDDLHTLTKPELAELGLAAWNEQGLMLFPVAWFDTIPEGFVVETINGERKPFAKSMSRDQRFGCLAFGVIAKPS